MSKNHGYDQYRQNSLTELFNSELAQSQMEARIRRAVLGNKSDFVAGFDDVMIHPDDKAFSDFCERVKRDHPLIRSVRIRECKAVTGTSTIVFELDCPDEKDATRFDQAGPRHSPIGGVLRI